MTFFITGIGTDVGKTVASAIITQALGADYWKPVQSGDLDNTDTMKVQKWVTHPSTTFHPSAYALTVPASPHLSAALDGVEIKLDRIVPPATDNHLIIEGAGGVWVPLNQHDSVIDLIRPEYKVIVVSRHYLGSINHTLLTIEALRGQGCNIAGIVFNGDEHRPTEDIILSRTGLSFLGRIENEPYLDGNVVADYAEQFRPALEALLP